MSSSGKSDSWNSSPSFFHHGSCRLRKVSMWLTLAFVATGTDLVEYISTSFCVTLSSSGATKSKQDQKDASTSKCILEGVC